MVPALKTKFIRGCCPPSTTIPLELLEELTANADGGLAKWKKVGFDEL